MTAEQKHVKKIASDGYTIVEGVLDAGEIAEIRDDLKRLEQALEVKPARNTFEGKNTLRMYNLLVHGVLYERIATHPKVLSIVERVLDPGCLVSSLSSIAILPGEVAQPIHADDQLIPIPKPHVPLVCNSMWAITDFTEENGATRIIPGSHDNDQSPTYGVHYDSVPALMSKGSVMIYHGSLWHGGGANQSAERRVGVAMNYCAGYIRQQENQQLGIPPRIVRGFSPRLRELVGYSIYNRVIGHVAHKHPETLLNPKHGESDSE